MFGSSGAASCPERPKVSVLVPIYNTAAYLRQCLEALAAQTLTEIEVICLDDGSTDESPAIVDEFATRDARFVAIHKENSGYGSSMNLGLDKARGEYVAIVESDDYPERAMLKTLYSKARRHGCDLVKSNFYERYDGRDHRNMYLGGHAYGKLFDPADDPRVLCTIPAIWTGLYKTSMIRAEGIRFRETPGAAFQDTAFTLKAWMSARSCVLVRRPLLHYRMDNPASSVKTSDKALIVCDELAEAERFLRERPDRCARFIEYFHVDKFGKYKWNYERVSSHLKLQFLERMEAEFKAARDAGELNCALFDEDDARIVDALLSDGAEALFRSHPQSL